MFVIVNSQGEVTKVFRGMSAATIVDLATTFQDSEENPDPDFTGRMAKARELLAEDFECVN
jgi:hypothetical protein